MSDLRFPDALLDQIRDAVPISSVVGQYVTWDDGKSQPGRGDMWACCPFHAERDPSFHVLDQDGIYKCFVCADCSGDVFEFLVEISGISFVDAVKTVAAMAGIDVEQPRAPQSASRARVELPAAKVSHRPAAEPKAPKRQRQGKWSIFKTYDYEIDGVVQYQNVRIQFKMPDGSWEIDPETGKADKDFRQRRPSGLPDGSWVWGLKAGKFMRRRPGDDWRKLDEKIFAEWGPGAERLTMGRDVPHGIYRRSEVEIAISEGKTILFLEGEKAVDASWEIGQPATCNSGGGENFDHDIIAIFRKARVVASPDNDPQRKDQNGNLVFHPDGRPSFKGKDHAEMFCSMARGVADFVGLLELPGLPLKGDIVEWIAAGGTIDQLRAMIDSVPAWRPPRPSTKFGALSVKDAIKFAANHDWLVDDLIEAKGTFAFAGNSQSGKTFQVIELAFCVATGRKYWGRDVKQGLVVYQVGEGEDGFMKRLAGHMQDRGIEADGLPLEVLPKKINLFSGEDDTNDLIKAAKDLEAYYGIPLRMIVIDTYNKATRGANEISGQDVGKINERLERIMTECNCAVGVVDHLSAGGRVRGHGSKTGDITNMIIVEKDEKKVDRNGRPIRRMRLDKNKDGENGGTIPFVLRQVVVGFREDGKAITTCVVEAPDGNDEELEKSGRLPLNQSIILQTIRDVIARDGFPAPPGMPEEVRRPVVAWKTVMTELRRKWLYKAPENEPEAREHELHRIVTDAGRKLQNNGYIDRDNTKGIVWWTGKTDRPLFKPKAVEPAPPGAGVAPAAREEIKQMAMDEVPF